MGRAGARKVACAPTAECPCAPAHSLKMNISSIGGTWHHIYIQRYSTYAAHAHTSACLVVAGGGDVGGRHDLAHRLLRHDLHSGAGPSGPRHRPSTQRSQPLATCANGGGQGRGVDEQRVGAVSVWEVRWRQAGVVHGPGVARQLTAKGTPAGLHAHASSSKNRQGPHR